MSVYGSDLADWLIALLALGVVLALVRQVLRMQRDRPATVGRVAAWIAVLAALQIACAACLWFTLMPPPTRIAAETLVVLSARAQPTAQSVGAGRVVALPEAGARAGVEHVADLATALRRYSATRRVRVLGEGLTARDLDAARDVVIEFLPAAMPTGLVELRSPVQVTQGASWKITGRVAGFARAITLLRDPAGAVVARAPIGADGRFSLSSLAGAPGRADYSLRVMSDGRPMSRDLALPLQVVAGDRLRVLLLAGAPGPELKYLRRWAVDAGLDVRSEITLGAGHALRTMPAASRQQRFADADLVLLDERAWRALGDAGEDELLQAARGGAGVLLRVTGSLTPHDRVRLRRWGFEADAPQGAAAATRKRDAPERSGRGRLRSALQTRSPGVAATDAIALRDPRDGILLGLYRNEGSGRLGVWWAVDTYRRVLAGAASEHGAMWAHTVAELARPRIDAAAPRWMGEWKRVAERQTVCGLDGSATVVAPGGESFELVSTPEAGNGANRYCAGFWPRVPGWHALRMGAASWPLHVRSADEAPGLRAFATREQTMQLAALTAPVVQAVATSRRGARWPWFLAWLAVSATLWWLERESTRRPAQS